MLEASDILEINQAMIYVCLTEHAGKDFSGDIVFSHSSEAFAWKVTNIHVERQQPMTPDAEKLERLRSVDSHWPAFIVFMGRPNAAIEVSFRQGKVTRTLVRSL